MAESLMSDGNGVALLQVVALTDDLPEQRLRRGQVGTVVEALGGDRFLVEFSDNRGQTYALLPLAAHQLLPLRYQSDGESLARA
jgi:hypothetical protein